MFSHGETVTVERSGGVDRYGDQVSVTEFEVDGVAFAPRSSGELGSELHDFRNTVIVGMTMYAPYGTDIQVTDVIVRADGKRYHVVGEPGEWRSPYTGWEAGLEVALERVTG